MELTKHAHACVSIDTPGSHVLIDPGGFTPDAADLVAGTSVVLITHEHPDHFDEAVIADALDARPELRVYGPSAVVGRWSARPDQVTAVAEGDTLIADGLEVSVHGQLHAPIHADIERCANVGYLVGGRVYHPGDAYHVPAVRVTTLLLPTSGPWTKLGEAADYVRAVAPQQVVQIHEAMLSDLGQQSFARILGPGMLTDLPVRIVAVGDSVTT